MEGFKIYPNPANSEVFIEVNHPDAAVILLIDANGKLISTKQINNSIEKINVSDFSSGIYSCQILNNKNTIIQSLKLNISK